MCIRDSPTLPPVRAPRRARCAGSPGRGPAPSGRECRARGTAPPPPAPAARARAATRSAPQARIEGVARPVADQVERERREEDRPAREEHEPRGLEDVGLARRDEAAPLRHVAVSYTHLTLP